MNSLLLTEELEVAFLATKFVAKSTHEDRIVVTLVLKYRRIPYLQPKFTTAFKGHKNSPRGMKTKIHLDSKLQSMVELTTVKIQDAMLVTFLVLGPSFPVKQTMIRRLSTAWIDLIAMGLVES